MCVCQHFAPVDPLLCVSDLCYIVLLSYLMENKKISLNASCFAGVSLGLRDI